MTEPHTHSPWHIQNPQVFLHSQVWNAYQQSMTELQPFHNRWMDRSGDFITLSYCTNPYLADRQSNV